MSVEDPYQYKHLKSHFLMDNQVKGFVEGYAMALCDIMYKLTGDTPSAKSYDPMFVRGGKMHSYAFDMKDGGRHHPIEDYEDVGEITECLLEETLDWIKQEVSNE